MNDYKKDCDCHNNHEGYVNSHDRCIRVTDPKPKEMLLECGQNLESARFDTSSTAEQTFTLGRVIIDTSCLKKPEVKIEFSSIVFFQSPDTNDTGSTIELTFRLKRSCDNEEVKTVLTRIYKKETQVSDDIVEEIISSEPFTISFCELLCKPGCCEYIVEVSGNPANFVNIRTAVVDNLSLGAFAQGIGRENKFMSDKYHKKGCDSPTLTKHPNPKKIIFECDKDPQEAIFEILEPIEVFIPSGDDPPESQRLVENFPLGNVLIDARKLVRPIVLIEFSSQLFFKVMTEATMVLPQPSSLFRIRLKFVLTRKCDNGPEKPIRTWEYEKSFSLMNAVSNIINERTISIPFSVVHCESLIQCDCDCCEYAMTVTATTTSEPIFEEVNDSEFELFTTSDFINIREARVTKASMSGFALQECTDCCQVKKY